MFMFKDFVISISGGKICKYLQESYLKRWFYVVRILHNNHPEIDALNVFPVPDGDTGTNMSMTFNAGAAEIKDMDSDNIYDIAKKLSKGLLMGARGNSGVILSQIFRGFAMGLEGHESVDAVAFANAWKSGAEVAYKAVMRPVEGTILTVIRESSEKIVEYTQPGMEIEDVFSYFVKEAENSLERTPELLPVLKEVGVVDSRSRFIVGFNWIYGCFIR